MSIGKDLLDVPFGDMIFSMANAIANSQRKLDAASLRTLRTLAGTKFDYIPEVTEVLTPKPLARPRIPFATRSASRHLRPIASKCRRSCPRVPGPTWS